MMNQGGRTQGPVRTGAGAGGGRRGPGGAVGILHIVSGNDRGKQYPLAKPQTQIGRGADQDLILADIAVSRRHVVVTFEGERYRIKDLGSGNGTLINGVRTATALLNDGDQIEIGNTVLRFDHPACRPVVAAAPVPQAGPQQRTMMADAPGYAAPQQPAWPAPPSAGPVMTVSDSVPMPAAHSGSGSARTVRPGGRRTGGGGGGGLLDTPVKKAAVFGTLTLLVLLGGAVVLKKTMGGGREQAQKLFVDGTRAFAEGDYARAKALFAEVVKRNPESPQAARYLKQCDVEIHSRGALAQAQKYASARRWDDELKVLDAIDKTSASWEAGEKLRKAAVPEAINVLLADARDALADDRDAAKQKIEAALLLDPDSAAAQGLEQQLKAGDHAAATPPAVAADEKPAARAPREPAYKEPKPAAAVARKESRDKAGSMKRIDDDDDESGAGDGELLGNKSAAGPYKARDFAGAAAALRLQAKSQKGGAAQKSAVLATQVTRLGEIYAKAEVDKVKHPASAVSEYQQAAALDAQIAHGTHAGYFKSQTQKLARDAARQAFALQRYDTAFEMAKAAQKLGDDGGVMAQLKNKAAELDTKAAAMARSNPNGARTMWRMVLHMVPPGDPAYVKAQQGLSSAVAPKDEDED